MQNTVIVTHCGKAHRDEFLACCLLMACKKSTRIERVASVPNEFDGFAVDIGGEHDGVNKFDHHQMSSDNRTSSFGLVLSFVFGEKNANMFKDIFSWAKWTDSVDCCGPNKAADEHMVQWSPMFSSPIEGAILSIFSKMDTVSSNDEGFYLVMYKIGKELVEKFNEFNKGMEVAEKEISVKTFKGVTYIECTSSVPTQCLAWWVKNCKMDVSFCLTKGSLGRGEKSSVYRYNDDIKIDFSSLLGGDVLFAHKGGFFASFNEVVAVERLKDCIL